MLKKIIAIAIAFTMILSITSCSKAKDADGEGVISPVPKEGKAELTILLSSEDYALLGSSNLAQYISRFKKDFGVDIKLEAIKTTKNMLTTEGRDEYIKKLFVKLTTKDGPDLIFNHYMNIEPLIERQAFIDLRGKVVNLDKIYDSLLSDRVYYVPLAVVDSGMVVSRAALAELGLGDPDFNWPEKDFYDARNKWAANHKILFNSYEYDMIFGQFVNFESIYKPEEKKLILNTPEVRKNINDFRSYIFGGTYKLIPGYKYENYYNMIFEYESEESKKDREVWSSIYDHDYLYAGSISNIFRASNIQRFIKENAIIRDPRYRREGIYLVSYGFLVNKNGKNLDLAYEFINGLLSNDVQMAMFENNGDSYYNKYYPINKEIEADVIKLEAEAGLDPRAVQVKALVLQELKDGKYGDAATANLDNIHKFYTLIYKDLAKFILADEPYSDEQLQVQLKKMEDKYNIYLNE